MEFIPFIGQVLWCVPCHWPQCVSISLLILSFSYISAWKTWQFHLSLCHGVPPRCRFRSPGYHSTTAWIHLLSENLAMCPTQQNFYFPYTVITFFTPLRSQIISIRIYFPNDTPYMDLFIAFVTSDYSFFVVAYLCIVSQAKRCYWREWQGLVSHFLLLW